MTLSETDLPFTAARVAAFGARLHVPEMTGSTNEDLVAAIAATPADWPHLSLIVTDHQVSGRGRLGRTWSAPAGGAIAISVALDASALPVSLRGWVPLSAGVAMAYAVGLQIPDREVRVKWPNDILIDGFKISGILAEVVAGTDTIVVGSGVNTELLMEDFPVPTAISFASIGTVADVDLLINDYLTKLVELVEALISAGGDAEQAGILQDVSEMCATIGSPVRVMLPGREDLVGSAVGIGAGGELIVRTDGGDVSMTAGDVIHVR